MQPSNNFGLITLKVPAVLLTGIFFERESIQNKLQRKVSDIWH